MCLTFTYPPHLTLSIFPNHDTKIIPPSTSAIFSAVYIINYLAVPNDPPSLIRKKCYPTFLHHKTSALLSNFNALILSPRNSISRCSPKQFHCNESNSNNSISQCLPPCSTAFINEMNMLPQQVHITSNLQSSNNVTSAVLYYNAPPTSTVLFNATNTILSQKFNIKFSSMCQAKSNRIYALP